MFAAALLAATMASGAALVPSGASAATIPGPAAIPGLDVVRSVDPEITGVEQAGHRRYYRRKYVYHRPYRRYHAYSYYRPYYPRYYAYSYYTPYYPAYSYYPYAYYGGYYPYYYHRPYYRPGFSISIGGFGFGGRFGRHRWDD
jgi:hypothetical protein